MGRKRRRRQRNREEVCKEAREDAAATHDLWERSRLREIAQLLHREAKSSEGVCEQRLNIYMTEHIHRLHDEYRHAPQGCLRGCITKHNGNKLLVNEALRQKPSYQIKLCETFLHPLS